MQMGENIKRCRREIGWSCALDSSHSGSGVGFIKC
jgi:hypothetical protein